MTAPALPDSTPPHPLETLMPARPSLLSPGARRPHPRAALAAAGVLGLALALTACSSSGAGAADDAGAVADSGTSSGDQSAPDGRRPGSSSRDGARTPGVSGLVAAVDGECTAGFGGGLPGGRGAGDRPEGAPSGMPEDLPEDFPTDLPTDLPTDRPAGFGGLVLGTVVAVDGPTITVSASSPDGGTTEESVVVDDATTYTVQRTGSTGDVVVGQCLTAQGDADDSGTLTAASLTVSTPGDDGCTTGLGGRGGFGSRGEQGGSRGEQGGSRGEQGGDGDA